MKRVALALLLAGCAPVAAAPSAPPTTAPPTASPTPTLAPTATPDPARAELLVFFRAYFCPELETMSDEVRATWERYGSTRARADIEATWDAQSALVKALGLMPRPPAARDLHDRLIRSNETFLLAVTVYRRGLATRSAADQDEHLRLIAEHGALSRQVSDLIDDLIRVHHLVPFDLVNSADCGFLRDR